MVDIYSEVLKILYNDDSTKEEQATQIRKMIEREVIVGFEKLLMDYKNREGEK
jgi:hypothetical protein